MLYNWITTLISVASVTSNVTIDKDALELENLIVSAVTSCGNSCPELHRLVITLNILGNDTKSTEVELIEQKLQLQLALKLWNPQERIKLSGGQLGLYIQSLMAMCLNPRDYNGVDLVEEMMKRETYSHFEFALVSMALCQASRDSEELLQSDTNVDQRVKKLFNVSDIHYYDTVAMSAIALTCYSNKLNYTASTKYFKEDVHDLVGSLIGLHDEKLNPITVSLAAQAIKLSDFKRELEWNETFVFQHLEKQLNSANVSSMAKIANAYYLVPALFKKNWLQISCKSEEKDKEEEIYFNDINSNWLDLYDSDDHTLSEVKLTVLVGNQKGQSIQEMKPTSSIELSVPQKSMLIDVLREAQKYNNRFQFTGYDTLWGYYLTGIGMNRENLLTKTHWMMYKEEADRLHKIASGLSETSVNNNDHYVFWLQTKT